MMARRLRRLLSHCDGAAVLLGVSGGYCWKQGRSQLQPISCASSSTEEAQRFDEKAFWFTGTSSGRSDLLASSFDTYGGVIVDEAQVPKDPARFRAVLASSLSEWTKASKRGVWLQLAIEQAALIPIATAEFGFVFHHAERDHIMLTKWLPTNEPDSLPPNASHTVGVGAVVTDQDGRVLLVREKSGPAARDGIWKIPTGLADAGEELQDAALREVKEETGVEATFECLGSFCMNHQVNLAHKGKSNVFFIVKCQAKTLDVAPQASEIAEARWFSREEFDGLRFPEKGTVFDALNRSALSSQARLEAKPMSGGRRPGTRWYYYPTPRPILK